MLLGKYLRIVLILVSNIKSRLSKYTPVSLISKVLMLFVTFFEQCNRTGNAVPGIRQFKKSTPPKEVVR